MITNFTPNHLNWHPDLDHYAASKQRLLLLQPAGGAAVFDPAAPGLDNWRRFVQGRFLEPRSYSDLPPLSVCGRHNRTNAALAAAAARSVGCAESAPSRLVWPVSAGFRTVWNSWEPSMAAGSSTIRLPRRPNRPSQHWMRWKSRSGCLRAAPTRVSTMTNWQDGSPSAPTARFSMGRWPTAGRESHFPQRRPFLPCRENTARRHLPCPWNEHPPRQRSCSPRPVRATTSSSTIASAVQHLRNWFLSYPANARPGTSAVSVSTWKTFGNGVRQRAESYLACECPDESDCTCSARTRL